MTDGATIADYVRTNSYARVPSAERQDEGWTAYKKGYELRIVVKTQDDLKQLRRLLLDAGIQPGKAFRKAKQWVVPVYGKAAVTELLKYKPKARPK
ncbi:MAG: hypothetical protein HY741_28235 [Chloroflexi bacterium]|nr:hypothetical protein [Chloroflexota bacterium]